MAGSFTGRNERYFTLLHKLSHRFCALTSKLLNEAQSLQHKAYGLQPPCLRLTHAVTSVSSRLGMGCAGSALSQWHFQPPATRHFVAHPKQQKKLHLAPVFRVFSIDLFLLKPYEHYIFRHLARYSRLSKCSFFMAQKWCRKVVFSPQKRCKSSINAARNISLS